MKSAPISPLVLACLAATWLIWGSTYLAIKFALISFPPYFQMGTRFLAAGAILLLWTHWRGIAMPTAKQWRNATIIGALMLGGGMGGTAFAEKTVASGLVVAFVAVVPALIALVNLAFGVRPGRLEIVGMIIGVGGVLSLIRGVGFAASPAGLAAMVSGSICWSIGSVLSVRVFTLAPGVSGFASEAICGGLILMAMSALAGESFHWPPETLPLAAWFYLVVFGSLLAFNAYMILLSRTSAALAASYSFVNPVIAMLLGITLGGESITHREWLASAVIVMGVVLLVMGRRR